MLVMEVITIFINNYYLSFDYYIFDGVEKIN